MDLSIIIPVYNVSKYIEKCILSVLNNNLEQGYEIIVIDDASPDNSVEIVKGMMEIYPQIKLFRQENKGLGGARNKGVDNAKGQYVLFLDADDYLKENALVSVLDFSKQNALDILEYGAVGVTEEGAEVYRNSQSSSTILRGTEYLAAIHYMNSACNKLYRVAFLNKKKLRFKERIFIEDFEFNTRAFYFAKKVQAIDYILGCFVQTKNSITRNTNPSKNLKMVKDIHEVINLTVAFQQKESAINASRDTFFKDRIAFLTVTLLYNIFKLGIDKVQRKLLINSLISKGLYPVNTVLKDKKKNLFRVVANYKFVFLQVCNLRCFIEK
jgi:glycosyltransferase involved in cell wall biosynthesis